MEHININTTEIKSTYQTKTTTSSLFIFSNFTLKINFLVFSMSKPVIISGEASETDSEDEIHNTVNMMKSVQGAIVTGEDSESENDDEASIASAVSALNLDTVHTEGRAREDTTYDSLFHQKLRDCNIQLYNNIENTCQNVIVEAGKNLNNIEQQLLRSQLTMQNAVTSLKTLSINSLMIKSKLHSLLSSDFLSNVAVKKS